jgi:hypothetical protein
MSYFIRFRLLGYKYMLIASKKINCCLLLIFIKENYSELSFIPLFPSKCYKVFRFSRIILRSLIESRSKLIIRCVFVVIHYNPLSRTASLCVEINSQMHKFWWGHQENKSRVSWMSWERMGLSKESRGMEFCDFESFNKTLLTKQSWRLW